MRVRRGGRGAGGGRGEERGWGGAVWLGLGRRGAGASHGCPVGGLGGRQVRRAWGRAQGRGKSGWASRRADPGERSPRAPGALSAGGAPQRPLPAGLGGAGARRAGAGACGSSFVRRPRPVPVAPANMALAGSLPQPRGRFPRALFRAGRGAGAAALRNRAGEGRGGTPAAGHPGDALPAGARGAGLRDLGFASRNAPGWKCGVGTAQRWGSRSPVASCTDGAFWAFPGGGGVGLRNGFSHPRRCMRITKFVYAIVFISIWFL